MRHKINPPFLVCTRFQKMNAFFRLLILFFTSFHEIWVASNKAFSSRVTPTVNPLPDWREE